MLILNSIETKLKTKLIPTYIYVENESHLHHVPKGSQTHFKIEVVAAAFENKRLLERHRLVNEIISDEIIQIRACSLYTFTPAEWEMKKNEKKESPKCLGGSHLK